VHINRLGVGVLILKNMGITFGKKFAEGNEFI